MPCNVLDKMLGNTRSPNNLLQGTTRAVESQPGTCGDRMTGNGAKIWTDDEKSVVEVRRKSAEMSDLPRISVCRGLSGRCIGRVDGQKR